MDKMERIFTAAFDPSVLYDSKGNIPYNAVAELLRVKPFCKLILVSNHGTDF